MPDFVDEKRREMEARLKELRPMVEEFARLEAAVSALQGVGATAVAAPARAARRAAPKRRAQAGAAKGRRGRPKGSGQRGKQALDLVKKRPGITIPEIAEKMGIQQNYLYRVLPGLAEEGKVVKSGRGWHLREGAAS